MLFFTNAFREISDLFATIGEIKAVKVFLVLAGVLVLGAIAYLFLPVALVIALIMLLWQLLGELGV